MIRPSNWESTPQGLRSLLEEYEDALMAVNEKRGELIRARSKATALRVQLIEKYGVDSK